MPNELKQCPLCNSDAEMHFDKLAGKTIYMIKCSVETCQCQEMGWHEDQSKAAIVWNTRPIETKLNAEISKLKKALDLACERISDITCSCPLDSHDLCMFDEVVCNGFKVGEWGECWKEYYINKAGE